MFWKKLQLSYYLRCESDHTTKDVKVIFFFFMMGWGFVKYRSVLAIWLLSMDAYKEDLKNESQVTCSDGI